jgi:hypothetical protein
MDGMNPEVEWGGDGRIWGCLFFTALPEQKSSNSGWNPTVVIHKEDTKIQRLSGECQSGKKRANNIYVEYLCSGCRVWKQLPYYK